MHGRFSLRLVVPAIILIFGIVVSATLYELSRRQSERQFEEFARVQIAQSSRLVANEIQAAFRRGDPLGARARLMRLASDPNILAAVLIDEFDNIIFSTTLREVDENIVKTRLRAVQPRLVDARRRFVPLALLSEDGLSDYSVIPIRIGGGVSDSLLPRRIGVFVMETDLSAWRNQAARSSTEQWLVVAALMVLLCTVIAVFMHYFVTRRVRLLVAATSRIASGDFENLPKTQGSDEISGLSKAITEMAGDLKDSIDNLSKSERRLASIMDNAADGVVAVDGQGRVQLVNRKTLEIFGLTLGDIAGTSIFGLVTAASDESKGWVLRDLFEEIGSGRRAASTTAMLARRIDGSTLPVDVAIGPVRGDDEIRFVCLVRDVSEQQSLQAQLRQTQKMEAVGQLTGGIAHDFNNLLNVIILHLEMMRSELPADAPMQRRVEHASRAAQRSADLTQRLLAFSRKQTLQPVVTDLNELVSDMFDMLTRTLGQTIDIRLACEDGLYLCDIDPAQMESAILNLVINARDAMPDGGSVTLETANVYLEADAFGDEETVEPGRYVMLAVNDTGSGMPPEIVGSVFEPFFTTKPTGQGTGLGLSMVFGFVSQSGGHIRIDTEVGRGTHIRLYFPEMTGMRQKTRRSTSGYADVLPSRGETVLVVEDVADLRELIVETLTPMNYRVLAAEHAPQALEIIRRDNAIDLLFTDLMLPGGMNGADLAREARKIIPDLNILLGTGYTGSDVAYKDLLSGGVELLRKPYRLDEIPRAIRRALDGKQNGETPDANLMPRPALF